MLSAGILLMMLDLITPSLHMKIIELVGSAKCVLDICSTGHLAGKLSNNDYKIRGIEVDPMGGKKPGPTTKHFKFSSRIFRENFMLTAIHRSKFLKLVALAGISIMILGLATPRQMELSSTFGIGWIDDKFRSGWVAESSNLIWHTDGDIIVLSGVAKSNETMSLVLSTNVMINTTEYPFLLFRAKASPESANWFIQVFYEDNSFDYWIGYNTVWASVAETLRTGKTVKSLNIRVENSRGNWPVYTHGELSASFDYIAFSKWTPDLLNPFLSPPRTMLFVVGLTVFLIGAGFEFRQSKRARIIYLFILLLLPFVVGLGDETLHSDEPLYMSYGFNSFELLIKGRLSDPGWRDNNYFEWANRGNWPPLHPPFMVTDIFMPAIPKYLIGGAIWIAGYTDISWGQIQATIIHDRTMLVAARMPAAILGALTCLVCFYLAKDMFSEEVGYFTSFFLALNPLWLMCSRRALLDTPAVFFGVLTICFLYRALRISNSERERDTSMHSRLAILPFVLAGFSLGFSWGSKYNTAVLTLLIAIAYFCVAVLQLRIHKSPRLLRTWTVGIVVCLITAFVLFVGSNPYFWTDTLKGFYNHFSAYAYWSSVQFFEETRRTTWRDPLSGFLVVFHKVLYPVILSASGGPNSKFSFGVQLTSPWGNLGLHPERGYDNWASYNTLLWTIFFFYGVGSLVTSPSNVQIWNSKLGGKFRDHNSLWVWFGLSYMFLAILIRSNYDRYFVPILPPISIIAAFGLANFVGTSLLTPRKGCGLVLALVALFTASVGILYPVFSYRGFQVIMSNSAGLSFTIGYLALLLFVSATTLASRVGGRLTHPQARSTRRILIVGHYGMKNLGDDAMLKVIAFVLKRFGNVTAFTLRRVGSDSDRVYKEVETVSIFNPFACTAAFLKADLILFGGGTLIKNVSLLKLAPIFLFCLLSRKKTAFYSVEVQKLHILTLGLAKIFLSRAGVVAVRNQRSVINLRGTVEHVKVVEDLVYGLPSVARFPNSRLVRVSEKKVVGVNVRPPLLADLFDPREYRRWLIPWITSRADTLILQFFVIHPIDRKEIKTVRKMLPRYVKSSVVEWTTVEDAIEKISKVDRAVGMRLHFLVIASILGKEWIAIPYGEKIEAFIERRRTLPDPDTVVIEFRSVMEKLILEMFEK